MSSDRSRQRRLAEHYLGHGADSGRLQKTAALAARSLDFPMAQVNILDDEFQYTLGGFGIEGSRTERSVSMCQYVVDAGEIIAVEDLRADRRFAHLPGVQAGIATSYVGVPIESRESTPVGTLCVFDSKPRRITPHDIARLTDFGHIVEDQLDVIRRTAEERGTGREAVLELSQAIERGEIVSWYQPVVDLGTGERSGFEALARWERPGGTTDSPIRFMALAEASDLVVDLDRAVIEHAMRDLARWHRTHPDLRMNINLSTRHLELPDGAAAIMDVVADAGVDPRTVTVEITETRGMVELAAAAAAVRMFGEQGYRVVLDDFGNGWSALDWLLGLPVQGIKVDRLVTETLGSRVGDAISRAVVAMSGELGISTTLEGISTREHLDAATAFGFRYGQGYLWSPPVPGVVVDATF